MYNDGELNSWAASKQPNPVAYSFIESRIIDIENRIIGIAVITGQNPQRFTAVVIGDENSQINGKKDFRHDKAFIDSQDWIQMEAWWTVTNRQLQI